jgi:hypothetical protein
MSDPETCKFYLYVEPEFANSPKMKVETFQAKAWRAEESLRLVTICTVMKKRTRLRFKNENHLFFIVVSTVKAGRT